MTSRPTWAARTESRSNSFGVRWIASPARVTRRSARSRTSVADRHHRLALPVGDRAPEHRAQPGEQLVDPERLGDVVVGAGVERADLLPLVTDRRQDDDRQPAPAADLAAHLDSLPVGELEIEHDRVRRAARRSRRGPARWVSAASTVVARLAEDQPQAADDLRLVVDDEDPRTAHRAASGWGASGERPANEVPPPTHSGARSGRRWPARTPGRSRARARTRGRRPRVRGRTARTPGAWCWRDPRPRVEHPDGDPPGAAPAVTRTAVRAART